LVVKIFSDNQKKVEVGNPVNTFLSFLVVTYFRNK